RKRDLPRYRDVGFLSKAHSESISAPRHMTKCNEGVCRGGATLCARGPGKQPSVRNTRANLNSSRLPTKIVNPAAISRGDSMVEPVNVEEFVTRPERRKPETFEFVKVRVDGSAARLTLNRPEHNLLNEAILRELADGIAFAGERDDIKLVVIDSAC